MTTLNMKLIAGYRLKRLQTFHDLQTCARNYKLLINNGKANLFQGEILQHNYSSSLSVIRISLLHLLSLI